MSQTAQTNNSNTTPAFTTVQAYTLAVITLAIGIAVGYFARGSASPSTAGETTQAAAPATSGGAWHGNGLPHSCQESVRATAAGALAGNACEGRRASAHATRKPIPMISTR